MEFTVMEKQFEMPCGIGNFEELKKALVPKTEFYKNLVVTENSVKSAKTSRAELNGLKKALDGERKKIRERCLVPYRAVERDFDELISLIDEPIQAIDSQIKALDETAVQEKRKELEEHFSAENTLDFVELDDVLNPKWRNKTEKTESLKKEITAKIFQINSDFDDVKSMYRDSDLMTAVCAEFAETKSKEKALSYAVGLERFRMRLNASVSGSVSGNAITPIAPQTAVTGDSECSQTVSGKFSVTCTKKQLVSLRDFMRENGIAFEVV